MTIIDDDIASLATCASVNGFCMLSSRLARSCSQYGISRNMLQHTVQQMTSYDRQIRQKYICSTCKHSELIKLQWLWQSQMTDISIHQLLLLTVTSLVSCITTKQHKKQAVKHSVAATETVHSTNLSRCLPTTISVSGTMFSWCRFSSKFISRRPLTGNPGINNNCWNTLTTEQ